MKTIHIIHSANRRSFFTPLALLWCLVIMMFPATVRGADTFAATASLAAARYDHTATLLSNGMVLVAGGYGPGGVLASVELYDPATGTWASAGSLATARSSQVRALHVDVPLLSRNPTTGRFKLTLGIRKSADLLQFAPFPLTAPDTTINGLGQLEFDFTSPDNAAFFRLEAQ